MSRKCQHSWPPQDVQVAYHEAGHAVAHFLLRVPFEYVTIEPGEDYDGRVSGPGVPRRLREALDLRENTSAMRRFAEKSIMCLMAGSEAEARAAGPRQGRPGEPSPTVFVRDKTDAGQAFDIALRAVDEDEELEQAGAFVEWLRVRIKWLLARPRHWAAVEAVAQVLLERRTLTARDARKISRNAIAQAKATRGGQSSDAEE